MESYIALVLFDGRVCRVRYHEEPAEPASSSNAAASKDKRFGGGSMQPLFAVVSNVILSF